MSGGAPVLCIKCKQEIPDISVYCMFCGKKQVSASAAPVKKPHNPNGTGIRPLGSYCQRHTCYTRLHGLVPAVSDVVINSIVGHSNSKISKLANSYGHISLAAKLDAVNRLAV